MLILAIRSDKPEAELYLLGDKSAEFTWQAHRQLAETLLGTIQTFLADNGATLQDINQIHVFQGPGSFTGLRIGLSTANALAFGLGISVSAGSGQQWLQQVNSAKSFAVPEYGALPNITSPKK